MFVGATALLAALPSAAVASDAELISLEAQIRGLIRQAEAVRVERVEPFEEGYRLAYWRNISWQDEEERLRAASRFSEECGRTAATREIDGLYDQANDLFEKLCFLNPATPAGKAAKIRSYIVMAFPRDWLKDPEDWDTQCLVGLHAELAGVPASELAVA